MTLMVSERKTADQAESRWLPELLTNLAMASGIGYLAAAYTVSRWITRASPKRLQVTPEQHGLPYERLECRSADGYRLMGWAVNPPRPRATVALFHGMRRNRESILGRMVFLAAEGYRCVAFDHRAHGESGGRRTSFGYHEGRDVAAVLELIRQRWPNQPCAALGISMGAAALCFASAHSRACLALILESCYCNIGNAFAHRLRHGYPPWFQRLSRGIIWVTERRLGLRLEQLAPIEHIAGLAPAPVLLLTGSDDPHAPPDETQELSERCRGPRELWIVPNAGHKDVFETGGSAYQEHVLDFLARRLPA